MRIAWATDTHLDFAMFGRRASFYRELEVASPDLVLITGDISLDVSEALRELEEGLDVPVAFVLGNHDFYGSSIAQVRADVAALGERVRNLRYLPTCGAMHLTDRTALAGYDGWGDARLGAPESTRVMLNDFIHIADLSAYLTNLACNDRIPLHRKLRELGDAEAAMCREVVSSALESHDHVIVATHVPPFAEACWHQGALSSADWLPYFTCGAAGVVLRELATANPDKSILVLCGHTHSAGEAEILPNLRVLTGAAEYRYPCLQRVLEVE